MSERPTKKPIQPPAPRPATAGLRKHATGRAESGGAAKRQARPSSPEAEESTSEQSSLVSQDRTIRNNWIIFGSIMAAVVIIALIIVTSSRDYKTNLVLAGTVAPDLSEKQLDEHIVNATQRLEALYAAGSHRQPPVDCKRIENVDAVVKEMIEMKKPNGSSAKFKPGNAHTSPAGNVARQVNFALRGTINAANAPDLEYLIFRVYRTETDRQAGLAVLRGGRGETNLDPVGRYCIAQSTRNIQGPAFLSIREAINAFAVGFDETVSAKP